MNARLFSLLLLTIAVLFSVFFVVTIGPALWSKPDIWAGITAGFVNPFAAGYATDAILCWLVLLVWVIHDAQLNGIKYGWCCVLLGALPGVVVGLAVYLVMRERQLQRITAS